MLRHAFTMIELIFVIVIMGIIGKFGVEILANTYQNFLHTSLQNRLEAQSEAALTQIASRLQYRIKDTIATTTGTETTLRWVGYDIEGWRGIYNGTRNIPTWSGFIDLVPNPAQLKSPETNTTLIENTINDLSYGTKDINGSALFFIGQEGDINGSGWGGAITDQFSFAHPINPLGEDKFSPASGSFAGVDIFEFYQLAWSAYAVDFNKSAQTLTLYYNYQPWNGESETDAQSSLLMENVNDFNFQTVGNLIKVQVCVNDSNISSSEGYAVCKEKTIF